MLVKISTVEWYPILEVEPYDEGNSVHKLYTPLDIPEDVYQEYVNLDQALDNLQGKLRSLIKQARSKHASDK